MSTIIESYNGDSDMDGFALRIRQRSLPIPENFASNDTCSDVPSNKCNPNSPFVLPAIASTTSNDPLHNDFYSVLYQEPNINPTGTTPSYLGSIDFFLYEYTGGAWVELNQLTASSGFGTLYPLGTWADYPEFTGYKLSWQAVLTTYGEGIYRVVAVRTVRGNETTICHPIHCLQEYSVSNANQTVRFEWTNNGIVSFETGTQFNITNYGNINWQEMIRLKGFFGRPEDVDEVIEVTKATANYYEIARVKHEKSYKYTFQSSLYVDWVHSKLKDVAFVSNGLQVTDYNTLNQHTYQRFEIVKEPDGYTPDYITHNKCYRVSVAFANKKQDLGLRQCKVVSSGNCAPVTIKDQYGNVIATVPSAGTYVSGTSQAPCESGTVENSNSSYTNTVAAGGTLVLPDIDFTDSDGTTTSVPSVQDIVATPCTPQKNVASHIKTGQTTSYRTNDDGDLQRGRETDFTTLSANNPFGNTNRFTDDAGGQTYSSDWVIDWAFCDYLNETVIGWYRVEQSTTNFASAMLGQPYTLGGYNDCYIPNVMEANSIIMYESGKVLNYAPFNLTNDYWTSTTSPNNTTAAKAITNNNGIAQSPKTNNREYIVMRIFTFTELGL